MRIGGSGLLALHAVFRGMLPDISTERGASILKGFENCFRWTMATLPSFETSEPIYTQLCVNLKSGKYIFFFFIFPCKSLFM